MHSSPKNIYSHINYHTFHCWELVDTVTLTARRLGNLALDREATATEHRFLVEIYPGWSQSQLSVILFHHLRQKVYKVYNALRTVSISRALQFSEVDLWCLGVQVVILSLQPRARLIQGTWSGDTGFPVILCGIRKLRTRKTCALYPLYVSHFPSWHPRG